MGLDGVELIMAVEEEFGIEIDDIEAEMITTPGKLIEWVRAKVPRVPTSDRCECQHTFYQLRHGFQSILGTPRSAFCLETELEALLPTNDRQNKWQQLGAALPDPGQWPNLERPPHIVRRICAAIVCAGIIAVLAGGWLGGDEGLALGTVLALLAVMPMTAALGAQMTRRCRTVVPTACRTVRRMVRFLAPRIPGRGRRWTDQAIAEGVRSIIREQLGIRKFSDDDHFTRDLGIG